MKDLRNYFESKKNAAREIYEYVDVWIDEQYQEGVVAYDDEHLKKYAKGSEKPNYKEIATGVVKEFEKDMQAETKKTLEKFIDSEKGDKNIEDIIDSAIGNFAASLEFPGY